MISVDYMSDCFYLDAFMKSLKSVQNQQSAFHFHMSSGDTGSNCGSNAKVEGSVTKIVDSVSSSTPNFLWLRFERSIPKSAKGLLHLR